MKDLKEYMGTVCNSFYSLLQRTMKEWSGVSKSLSYIENTYLRTVEGNTLVKIKETRTFKVIKTSRISIDLTTYLFFPNDTVTGNVKKRSMIH